MKAHCATKNEVLGLRMRPRKIKAAWRQHYRRLLQLRERLIADQNGAKSDATAAIQVNDIHPAEGASDEFDHDLALSLLSSTQDSLNEIDQALRRIENGTYGFCELTGRKIPVARLNVIPWTRFSLEGEAQLEASGQIKPPRLELRRSIREKKVRVEGGEDEEEAENEFEPEQDGEE